jgi:hypothetical protein
MDGIKSIALQVTMVDDPDTTGTLEGNVKPVLEVETASDAKSPNPNLQALWMALQKGIYVDGDTAKSGRCWYFISICMEWICLCCVNTTKHQFCAFTKSSDHDTIA